MRLRPLLVLLALLPLTVVARADTPAPGWTTADLPNGAPTYRTATLSNGEFVAVGNLSIAHYQADGTLIQTLHVFSQWIPAESVAVDPTETFLIACRSDGYNGGMWRVDIAGGPVTMVSFFSASHMVFVGPNELLTTVTDGLLGWWMYRMDLLTGQPTQVSQPYPSVGSPLDLDAAGNVYLGYDNGSASSYVIERFTPAQINAPGLLATGTGTVVHQGPNGIQALDVTPDGSTFYVAEWVALGSDRLVIVDGGASQLVVTTTGNETLFAVEHRPGTPPAALLPYQPPEGGEIVYQTYFSSTNSRKAARPLRPTAAVSGPGTTGVGPFDVTVSGGPPNGRAVVYFGPLALYNPIETAYFINGLPLFIGLDRPTAQKVAVPIVLDPNGTGMRTFQNTSGATNVWAIQTVLIEPGSGVVGSSTAAFL